MVAMIGGTALYLIANILFKRLVFNSHPLSHYIGLALLTILCVAASHVPPVAVAVATTLILVLVAIQETVVVMRKNSH
jgi:low temperature requirement protein LtrA